MLIPTENGEKSNLKTILSDRNKRNREVQERVYEKLYLKWVT